MIFDLENSDKIQENVDCDIVIIGAGTAGLYLANKLYNSSFKIILIDCIILLHCLFKIYLYIITYFYINNLYIIMYISLYFFLVK